jgi:HipA-like protein
MNGAQVGRWNNGPGEPSVTYDESWVRSPAARPLSISLPFRSDNAPYRGQIVHDFFDNLLPDSEAIRRRLAQHHRADSANPFDLLAVLGRDCVGAIQLMGVKGSSGLHYRIAEIRRRHWHTHGREIHLDKKTVDGIIQELIEATDSAIGAATAMLPAGFPSHVADSIFMGLRAQRDKLAQQTDGSR